MKLKIWNYNQNTEINMKLKASKLLHRVRPFALTSHGTHLCELIKKIHFTPHHAIARTPYSNAIFNPPYTLVAKETHFLQLHSHTQYDKIFTQQLRNTKTTILESNINLSYFSTSTNAQHITYEHALLATQPQAAISDMAESTYVTTTTTRTSGEVHSFKMEMPQLNVCEEWQ